MFDFDLAALYEVPTRALNQALRRNVARFPEDFAFQLSKDDLDNWRSQIVTSNPAAKMGLRRPPFAFTQEGIAMLSSVLRSDRAIRMNIAIRWGQEGMGSWSSFLTGRKYTVNSSYPWISLREPVR